jgi:PAS domain S-box-containing protein
MDIYEFAQKIEEWRSRMAVLLQDSDSVQRFANNNSEAEAPSSARTSVEASELPSSQQELALEPYEEINVAVEELQVAQEELLRQNEELAGYVEELMVTRQIVEAERQRYQELFEFAPEGYLVTDPQGTIQEANRAAANLLNLSQQFLKGKQLLSFVPSDEHLTFESKLKQPRQGDWIREWELCLQPRNRKPVDVAVTVAAVRDKEGKAIALRWLLRDIRERKQAELALQRANEQLNEEIAERQKAEAAVKEALETEKELSELKSRFIATISHEYRTPLTTILFSAELLDNYSDKLTQKKKSQHLKRIQASVHHLTHLVEDALFINQLEVQKVQIKPTLLDLSAFCQELVEDLKLTALAQHAITFESKGDCSQVYLDEKLLRQILTNLLSNAIKYSPKGGTVWFSCSCDESQVTFCIQDEGIGIPAEDLPQLMQSFYRASNAGIIPGTGLGLAIVKKCVDLHGGQIALESQIGIGTTFTVTLPLQQSLNFQQANYSNPNG